MNSGVNSGERGGARVWRYSLPYCQKGDGGTFFIDSTGVFTAYSPYGSYGYRWSAFGTCIRAFIAQIDATYAYGKLAHDRGRKSDLFDGAATAREIRKVLFSQIDKTDLAWWADELELIREVGDFQDSPEEFSRWCAATHFEQPWHDFYRSKTEPECWAFCTLLLPRLQARLRFDLAREAGGAHA